MDHYEVRKYSGWHHHMLTTMLAHFFSVAPEGALGEKKPRPSPCHSCGRIGVVLPLRTYTIADVLVLAAWVQRRNHQAYRCAQKAAGDRGLSYGPLESAAQGSLCDPRPHRREHTVI